MKIILFILLIITMTFYINFKIFSDDSAELLIKNIKLKLILNTPDYVIIPGDRFLLEYSNKNEEIWVDSNYVLTSQIFGNIKVKGLTLQILKDQITEKMQDILGKNIVYKLNMIDFGVSNILIKGEIKISKYIQGSGIDRLDFFYSIIEKTEYSSIRNIKVIRDEKETFYDLFLYYRNGDLSQNPIIMPQDIIEILHKEREIKITGAVRRSGIYELKQNEDIKTLLDFTGGFKENSYQQITKITTYNKENEKFIIKYINLKEKTDYNPAHLDEIFVYDKSIIQPIVFIEGAIKVDSIKVNPDKIDESKIVVDEKTEKVVSIRFNDGEKILDILKKIDGFFEDADLENSYIVRQNDGVNIFKINIFNLIYKNDFNNNIEIFNLDRIVIPLKQTKIAVLGMVKNPVLFEFERNKTALYYIQKAGGVIPINGNNSYFWLIRKGSNKPLRISMSHSETTIINEGDRIEIKPSGLYWVNSIFPTINSFLGLTISASSLIISISDFYYRLQNY